MIIMALDHVRDFTSHSAQFFPPDDLSRTTAALFFTRWITHFCAPTFMFTAGIGAFLWMQKGRTIGDLSRFLLTRGLWLVLVDVTVMRFALTFSFLNGPIILLVFWALGASMIVVSLLIRIPVRALAVISLATIATHNLFDKVNAAQFGSWSWLWNVVHQQGAFKVGSAFVVVGYPLVPWIDVMAAGFCFGQVFLMEAERRQRLMIRIGAGMTIGFLAIRALNVYGDPRPWVHSGLLGGALSFLNCAKYPPSLDYLLMTLGPALLVLAWFDRCRFSSSNPLIVFGRVPFFFFVGHFYTAHVLAVVLAWFRYGHAEFMLNPLPSLGGPMEHFPADYGYGLVGVYLCWIFVVAAFFPLCRWFAGLKSRRTDWWLSYL
jgi:uncharacterized membrane protein